MLWYSLHSQTQSHGLFYETKFEIWAAGRTCLDFEEYNTRRLQYWRWYIMRYSCPPKTNFNKLFPLLFTVLGIYNFVMY